jgi:hypothetical protein
MTRRTPVYPNRVAGAIVLIWVVCFLSLQFGHLAFPAEIPSWLVVTGWFSGIAIFGIIGFYNKWTYGAYFPFKGPRPNSD